jgi:hypothetical protein
MNDLDELLRLHGEATGGEWCADPDGREGREGFFDVMSASDGVRYARFVASDIDHEPDARYIAAAHNALPGLVERVRRAEAAVDCGQNGPCAVAPGCQRHWEKRNRELVAERDALREVASEFFTDEELDAALAKVPR